MRFMMVMYPDPKVLQGEWMPTEEDIRTMTRYNEQLVEAGVLLAGDGLHPPQTGVRVRRGADGKNVVTDGPFAEAKEVVGGYWMIQVRSKEEAVQWASRVPLGEGDMVELRQVMEAGDFPEEVQGAVAEAYALEERAKKS